MQVAITDVQHIINELGSGRFPWQLHNWLNQHAMLPGIYHSVAMLFDRESTASRQPRHICQAKNLFAASIIEPEIVSQALDLYTRQEEWRHDELIARIERNPMDGMRIERIPPPSDNRSGTSSYQRLYIHSQLGIEYAITLTDDRHVYTYSIFQKRDERPFNSLEVQRLFDFGPFVLTLLNKHAQLCQQPLSTVLTPQQAFTHKLISSGIRLSTREYNTCISVLSGNTIAQISSQMNVKETSVRTYLGRALIKLNLPDKQALYQWCFATNISSVTEWAPRASSR